MPIRIRHILALLLMLAVSVTLVACGGGGSSTSTPAAALSYSISGKVAGTVTSGVTLTLSGASSSTTVTAADGSYQFGGLAAGTYTVTPSLSGHIFNPASASNVVLADANLSAVNFQASDFATSCDPSKPDCSVAVFVADEVVSGLNYTCSSATLTITSVTDANGIFTCPSGSSATFYLAAPAGSPHIVLGTATVITRATMPPTVGMVSPIDLAGARDLGGSTDPTANPQVLNIVRFLKAVDMDGNTWKSAAFSAFKLSNKITISSQVTQQLAALPASIGPDAFQGSDLSPALQSFISSIPGKQFNVDTPSSATTQQALIDYLHTSYAGLYTSPGWPCNSGNSGALNLSAMGMCNLSGASAAPKSGDLLMLVDRTGFGLGFGVTSTSTDISVAPVPFELEGLDAPAVNGTLGMPDAALLPGTAADGRPFNYMNSMLSITAGSLPATGPALPMQWTGVLTNGIIPSSIKNYEQLLGAMLPASASNVPGVWQYDNSSNPLDHVSSGQFFLSNIRQPSPYLDSAIIGALTFPINLQLTFEYPATGGACPAPGPATDPGYCLLDTRLPTSTGATALGGTLQISILQNGNIITNLNQDCNQLANPLTAALVDSNNQTEYRLGYVSYAKTGVMASDASLTPVDQLALTLVFPANANANLPSQLQSVMAGFGTGAPFNVPVSGSHALQVVLADKTTWFNYLKYARLPNSPPVDIAGIIRVQPAASNTTTGLPGASLCPNP